MTFEGVSAATPATITEAANHLIFIRSPPSSLVITCVTDRGFQTIAQRRRNMYRQSMFTPFLSALALVLTVASVDVAGAAEADGQGGGGDTCLLYTSDAADDL